MLLNHVAQAPDKKSVRAHTDGRACGCCGAIGDGVRWEGAANDPNQVHDGARADGALTLSSEPSKRTMAACDG